MSQEKLAEYIENSRAFLDQASKLDVESIEVSSMPGQWSPAYVMHHVADSEMHFAIRYFNALTIENPPVIPFKEDEYPDVLNYHGRDWRNSLAIIEAIGKLVESALNSISHQQWERMSLHPELGQVSISTLITKAGNHMQAHTEQLKEVI